MSAKLKKLFIFLFLANIFCLHAKSVPTLQSRVNDYANVISQSDKSQLESLLYSLENSTGIQIAVLTIDSLEGENLEDYSMKVAETWKIGQKGDDNGAILLVAMEERKVRLEIGYGLEDKLTDTKCGLIIRNIIIPEFRNGNYSEGIFEGVKNMIGIVSEDETLISNDVTNPNNSSDYKGVIFGLLFVFGWFVLFSSLASGPKNHWLPWIIFTSEYRKQHRNYTPSSRNSNSSSFSSFSNFGGGGGFRGGGGGFGGGGASGGW